MKHKSLMKHQLIINCCIITAMMLGVICSILQYRSYKEYAFYNNARMLTADSVNQILECFIDREFQPERYQKGKYQAVIIDLSGEIVYSEKDGYPVADTVDINEFIQIDQSLFLNDSKHVKMAFALTNKNEAVGFAAFFIPREDAIGLKERQVEAAVFLPVILACCFIGVIVLLNVLYMKKRIINPVNEITASSRAIIRGDYRMPIVNYEKRRHMDNDIDLLVYNFELMRDELEDKRRREEELKRSQKELISCISHDLKTPISTITAYSEGLRDGLAKSPEKVHKYAEVIVAKAQILTKMIRDLLEHFNAEMNQLSIHKKEQYFNDYMDQLSKELEQVVHYNHMDYSYENNAPNLLVSFDENRMTQAIMNLIDNSVKYMGNDHGKITIRIGFLQGQKQLRLQIQDNGQGIGATDIPFVFDKFYRGEKSRNMSIPGSGLGLSICKYIVEEHGGEICCESRPKEGTILEIYLPV